MVLTLILSLTTRKFIAFETVQLMYKLKRLSTLWHPLNRRLNGKKTYIHETQAVRLKLRDMYWLLGRTSELSTEFKLFLYKSILKPICILIESSYKEQQPFQKSKFYKDFNQSC